MLRKMPQGTKFKTMYTNRERRVLKKYKRRWKSKFSCLATKDSRAIFHLGDDADARCVWSGIHGSLPTLRKSMP